MHNLKIELGNCVRVYAKNSTCTKCQEICPHNAISYAENIPLVGDSCTDCGGCIGVCPTEAISLKNFDTLDFIFSFLENDEELISCKKNIPCLATLSVENLISLALLGERTLLDLGHCASCDIKEPLFTQIEQNITEANSFLAHIQSDKRIDSELIAYEEAPAEETPDRRDFLKRFSVKGAIKSKIEFEQAISEEQKEISDQDTQNIRKKEIPNKRKLLFMALKRADKPATFHTYMPDEISFTSQKNINDNCDNCSMCYRICPTGALQSDRRQTKIEFDPLMCVKCALCHDVCEPDAITLIPYSTKELFEPKVIELANFTVARCDECANFFTWFGGEKICPRCKIEEEEAKTLWGIQ
ncbi:MAG: 4Fe-4S ferredoxin [Sulfurospirillum sp.]|nr:MAG: 4Fe-4S ferredoxin [Sulfurospirillum sp.]